MARAEQEANYTSSNNIKHNGSSSSLWDGDEKQQQKKNMEQEVRKLISALTNRLSTIQDGVGIITLAGSNVGPTMRGEVDVDDHDQKHVQGRLQPSECEEDYFTTTYVNSNFQAVNNSILLRGSYHTNDPGVHLDISDYYAHVDSTPMNTTASRAPAKHVGKKKMANKNILFHNKGTSSKNDDDHDHHHTHHHSDDN